MDIFALAIWKVGSLGAGFFGFGFIVAMLIVGSVSDSAVASEITLGGAILMESAVSVSNVSCADLADSLVFHSVSLNQGLTRLSSRHHRRLGSASASRANASGTVWILLWVLLWILFGGSYYRSSSLGYPESPSGLSLVAFVKRIYENHRPLFNPFRALFKRNSV